MCKNVYAIFLGFLSFILKIVCEMICLTRHADRFSNIDIVISKSSSIEIFIEGI